MTRVAALIASAAAFASLGACYVENCDAKALPFASHYRVEAEPSDGRASYAIFQAEMHIGKDEVTVEYERGDGKRFRATYAIRARGTTFR